MGAWAGRWKGKGARHRAAPVAATACRGDARRVHAGRGVAPFIRRSRRAPLVNGALYAAAPVGQLPRSSVAEVWRFWRGAKPGRTAEDYVRLRLWGRKTCDSDNT